VSSPRTRASSFLLTLRLRSRRCWTSWHLRLTTRAQARELRRTLLLQESLDSSLLRQKELEQLRLQQEHRLQEMADSRQFHQQGQLPPSPEPLLLSPPEQSYLTHLDRLLHQKG
jgi:hypothetical protein